MKPPVDDDKLKWRADGRRPTDGERRGRREEGRSSGGGWKKTPAAVASQGGRREEGRDYISLEPLSHYACTLSSERYEMYLCMYLSDVSSKLMQLKFPILFATQKSSELESSSF